ncbi:hypothetical protein [Methylobacterium sp. XJLW]|uniref:hypothetical protein n=1 Tax=Methylobacterium sp. XJLW TaxID=739141 RepID=UPI000F55654A|nr:hypothetical protein [Methylobacterium sp. XJLW]
MNGILGARGIPGGFASLGADGLVPREQVPLVGSLYATAAGKRAVETSRADDLLTASGALGAVTRTLASRLDDLPVYPQDYWTGDPTQFCDGATDVSAAYRAAATVAMTAKRPLHIGGKGLCVLGSTIPIKGPVSLIGDGQARSILVATFNGPIFTWDTNGPGGTTDATEVSNALVQNFSLRGQFASGADNSASRGFTFTGNNANFFQYNHFRNLTFEGLYAAFDNGKASFATSFGQESTQAWLSFDDITIRGGSGPAMYGWIWNNGSGTGTTYNNIKTAFYSAGAVAFYYPAGVVGDIVINGGHFGGTNSELIKVGTSTNYRNNILVSGSQLDAGMNVPFDFAPNSPTFQRISFTGNNLGGGVTLNTPPVADSLIDDQLVDQRRAGKNYATNATGQQIVPLFAVTLDSLNPYTGTDCTVNVSGLVGGVGGGIVRQGLLIARNGGGAVVLPVGTAYSTQAASGFATVNYTTSGAVTTISTTIAPAASNTMLDAQIRCTGGTYAVSRL